MCIEHMCWMCVLNKVRCKNPHITKTKASQKRLMKFYGIQTVFDSSQAAFHVLRRSIGSWNWCDFGVLWHVAYSHACGAYRFGYIRFCQLFENARLCACKCVGSTKTNARALHRNENDHLIIDIPTPLCYFHDAATVVFLCFSVFAWPVLWCLFAWFVLSFWSNRRFTPHNCCETHVKCVDQWVLHLSKAQIFNLPWTWSMPISLGYCRRFYLKQSPDLYETYALVLLVGLP